MKTRTKLKQHGISSHLMLVLLAMLIASCQSGIKEQNLSELKTKNAEMLIQLVAQQSEIHLQQTRTDSLQTIINDLDDQVAKMSDQAPGHSEDEKSIRQMVNHMHVSWKELVSTKDPQQILDYFMPIFTAMQIDIDAENRAHMAAYTDLDYPKHLEEIISREDFSVEFGDVSFLDVSIKNREFFNVAYKCQMRQYQKDVLSETTTVMVTITGRRITNSWKIANYSLVTFDYAE